jgi:hypothetical protein
MNLTEENLTNAQFPMLNCHPRDGGFPVAPMGIEHWELSIGQIFPYLHSVIGGDI